MESVAGVFGDLIVAAESETPYIVAVLVGAIGGLCGVILRLYLQGKKSDDERLADANRIWAERLAEERRVTAERLAEKDRLIEAWQRIAIGSTEGLEEGAAVAEAALLEAKRRRR